MVVREYDFTTGLYLDRTTPCDNTNRKCVSDEQGATWMGAVCECAAGWQQAPGNTHTTPLVFTTVNPQPSLDDLVCVWSAT